MRSMALWAVLVLSAAAQAQEAPSPARQVELLAPQLLAFSGSAANFESLVNGLAGGTPVTLTQVSADGVVQVVTFAPGTALTPAEAARALESARQNLIAQGISAPTPQQIAVSLVGGVLPTAAGGTPLTGVLGGADSSLQVRNLVARPAASSAASAANLSPTALQALRTAMARNTSVTLNAAGGPVTFGAPGRAMSEFEINQALQLAAVLLAQQGVFDPTPAQLRTALTGGTLGTNLGGVPLRGVLQGQVSRTSDSPLFGTSDSQVIGTSNTPPGIGPGLDAGIAQTPAGVRATSPAPPAAAPAASIATTPRFRAVTRR